MIKTYNGGKNGNGTYQHIINHIPPHTIYVEPFLGSGAIFKRKMWAPISYLNDVDPQVIEKWGKGWEGKHSVYIMCYDFRLFFTIIKGYNTLEAAPEMFIYCDPPYRFATRSSQRKLYTHEFTDKDHREFLALAVTLKCNVMISHYNDEMYNEYLKDWHTHTYMSMARNGLREEKLYMNYPKPTVLHDTRYIGDDYRKREQYKLKAKRFISKFNKLHPHLQQAILSGITGK